MKIEEYLALVKDQENKSCTVIFDNGLVEEGYYLGESPAITDINMVIKLSGKSREKYEHIGVTPSLNPSKEEIPSKVGDKIGLRISLLFDTKTQNVVMELGTGEPSWCRIDILRVKNQYEQI